MSKLVDGIFSPVGPHIYGEVLRDLRRRAFQFFSASRDKRAAQMHIVIFMTQNAHVALFIFTRPVRDVQAKARGGKAKD
jgi:hypothetical protein